MVFIALRLGRQLARVLLYPVCVYFLATSSASRNASQKYLLRVLSRTPRLRDLFRHYYCFACCVLDRVFLLNDQIDKFDLNIDGEDVVMDFLNRGSGCLLYGAHIGSFEVLRALGRRRRDLRVSFVMYEDNARKVNSVLNAINPALAMDIIGLGRPGAVIEIEERLAGGAFVGVLADRSLGDDEREWIPFLGTPAPFPTGPFRMAALLNYPVVLMIALYRGGRRYDIYFEPLFDASNLAGEQREQAVRQATMRYAQRLEDYCRIAPYNWFNFYDFWR